LKSDDKYTKGFLYTDAMILEYSPKKLLLPNTYIPVHPVTFTDTIWNDCLTLAVNMLLRHQFFIAREQVQRLWQISACLSELRAKKKKIEAGVSVGAFKDFFVRNNFSYSIVEIEKYEGDEAYASLKTFIKQNLKDTFNFGEVLIICGCILNGKVVSHAGTFFRQMVNGLPAIKYFDSNENFLFEKGGPPMNYQTLFQKFKLITIYSLQGRQVDIQEEQKIYHKMTYVMTGVRTAEYDAYIRESRVRGGKKSQKKSNGWGSRQQAKGAKNTEKVV
jgi:hypothetical protein